MPTLSGSTQAPLFAQFGTMRFGATRFGYTSAHVSISIGGTQVAYGKSVATYEVEIPSLTIHDVLDETPNTCAFEIAGFTPTPGQEVIITLGSINNGDRLFAGHILAVSQRQVAAGSRVTYAVSAIDYTWRLQKLKVTTRYTSESATAIVRDLIATYASGFTSRHVVHDLDTIDEITFTEEDLPTALTRIAKRIGGYWYVDYHQDLHVFVSETGNGAPVDLTTAHASLRDFVYDADLSQVITRVYVEGRGSTVLRAIAAGDTRIPLATVDMFTVTADVFAKVSFHGSDGGAQYLTYTGVVTGGTGTVVGSGIGPASAPTLAPAGGAGLGTGVYLYGVTFVTGAGESLPSPTASATTGVIAPPATNVGVNTDTGGSITVGTHYWGYTFVNAAGETTRSPLKGGIVTAPIQTWNLTGIALGPSGTTARKIYRNAAGAGYDIGLKLVGTIADNTTTEFADSLADAGLGAAIPTTNTASAAQVDLTNIPIGGTGVTQRKVYRTLVGGAQLKLQSTIADNTTTTVLDATADGSLGANVPVTDTSGLAQPDGQVLPGATTLLVAGTGAFAAAGGWAIIGNGEQVIRYTGITSSSLTGIPASGVGAITATVAYNSTVTAAPMLTGIPASDAGAISVALSAGDEVYLVVQCDDLTAQATLAALIGGTDDGVREAWIQDRRLSITEATARGTAVLALRSVAEGSLQYTCRDTRTASGKTITVSLGSPTSVSGAFKIQEVTITNFHPALLPTYGVRASTTRYSYEQLLRDSRRRSGA